MAWRDGFAFYQGTLARRPIVMSSSGMGSERAYQATTALVKQFQPSYLLITGFAAGLRKEIRPGDLVIAHALIDRTKPNSRIGRLIPNAALLANTNALPLYDIGLHQGEVLSVEDVVTTAANKSEMAIENAGVLAVDMESAGAARAAEEHGVPWVVVRAITDSMHEGFPLDFTAYVGSKGEVFRLRIVMAILSRPWKIPALLRLGHCSWRAARNLARFVELFILQQQKGASFG